MKFYHVDSGDLSPYYLTLSGAKKDANLAAKTSYHDIVVKRVDVGTDQSSIKNMLNNASGHHITFKEVVYTAKAGMKKAS